MRTMPGLHEAAGLHPTASPDVTAGLHEAQALHWAAGLHLTAAIGMGAGVQGAAAWLQATTLSRIIKTVTWLIPLVQSIHILTIGVVFVSSLMIALRVLGLMRADEPFEAVWKRFAPWMWTGLGVMAVTGLTLVAGEPVREMSALSFWLKMMLLAIGVTGTAVYGRALRAPAPAGSAEFAAPAKIASVLIVILWLAVIFLGRAIAYDTEVWGSLSPHA